MPWRPDRPGSTPPGPVIEGSAGEIEIEVFDLTCPACENDLIEDARFASHRVCGQCGRHFAIGPRQRVALLVDSGVFQELDAPLDEAPSDRELLPAAERLAENQHLQTIGDAIVTGYGSILGTYSVVVALDDHLVSHSLGIMLSGKIIRAFEYARREKLPVVVLAAGGTLTVPAGPLSLAQGSRLATAAAQLHLDGVPMVGVLTQPMSTGIFATLASHCDVLLSEPNVVLHEGGPGLDARQSDVTARTLLEDGWIDGIVERPQLAGEIGRFLDVVASVGPARPQSKPPAVVTRPSKARTNSAADGVPGSGIRKYMDLLVPDAFLIRGDRVRGDDPGVACGFGRLDMIPVAFVGISLRSGTLEPAAAAISTRKIARLARLAGRLELPLVMVIDGGDKAVEAPFSIELAYAGASLASTLSLLPVPLISIGMGRVSGILATLMMNADRQFLISSAVITPPPEPTLGWQPGRPAGLPAGHDSLSASDCLRLGLIDAVINDSEGEAGGAAPIALAIRTAVVQALAELSGTGQRRLLDIRVLRQRTLGQSTPDGLAEARSELWALQEWQRGVERNVERSIDEWRGRWETLKSSQPRLNFQRPDMGDLAARVRARRADFLERAGRGDRTSQD